MYAATLPPVRRHRLNRAVRRLITICTLFILLGLAGPLVARVIASPEVPAAVEVTVKAGDTLWEIAQRHAKPGEDVREVVFRIRAANNLRTAVVHPGQSLRIPSR